MKLAVNAVIAVALGLRLHHHFHGPPIDYLGLSAAAAASWIGVPGPGEPILIAAGVFAAKHRLDIVEVLLFAWAGGPANAPIGTLTLAARKTAAGHDQDGSLPWCKSGILCRTMT